MHLPDFAVCCGALGNLVAKRTEAEAFAARHGSVFRSNRSLLRMIFQSLMGRDVQKRTVACRSGVSVELARICAVTERSHSRDSDRSEWGGGGGCEGGHHRLGARDLADVYIECVRRLCGAYVAPGAVHDHRGIGGLQESGTACDPAGSRTGSAHRFPVE